MGKRKGKVATGMTRVSLHLRDDQVAALKAKQDADGVPVAEQVRRALDAAIGTRKGGK
jgi:hypothetical protein